MRPIVDFASACMGNMEVLLRSTCFDFDQGSSTCSFFLRVESEVDLGYKE